MDINKDDIDQAVRVLQVIKRRYRVFVLDALDNLGPLTVGELVSESNKPQSEISQAIADLKLLNLVTTEKVSRTVTATIHETNWKLMQQIISALSKQETKSWNYH